MNYELGSLSSRFFANLFDSFLFFITPFLFLYLINFGIDNISIETIFIISYLLYLMKDITGRSLGKRILGLQIINKDGGTKVSTFRLFGRNLTMVFGIVDAVPILVTPKRQRLGDMLASTIVIKELLQDARFPFGNN